MYLVNLIKDCLIKPLVDDFKYEKAVGVPRSLNTRKGVFTKSLNCVHNASVLCRLVSKGTMDTEIPF